MRDVNKLMRNLHFCKSCLDSATSFYLKALIE